MKIQAQLLSLIVKLGEELTLSQVIMQITVSKITGFYNLTNINIPSNIVNTMSLGLKFTHASNTILERITSLENVLNGKQFSIETASIIQIHVLDNV